MGRLIDPSLFPLSTLAPVEEVTPLAPYFKGDSLFCASIYHWRAMQDIHILPPCKKACQTCQEQRALPASQNAVSIASSRNSISNAFMCLIQHSGL